MGRMGRPPKILDTRLIEKLASFGCTCKEIASALRCSDALLERPKYVGYMRRGRDGMCRSLKRKQYELAMGGDRTMLIWLGKQYMGQSDKTETQQTGGNNVNIVVKVVEDDNWYGNADRLIDVQPKQITQTLQIEGKKNGNGRVRLKL